MGIPVLGYVSVSLCGTNVKDGGQNIIAREQVRELGTGIGEIRHCHGLNH